VTDDCTHPGESTGGVKADTQNTGVSMGAVADPPHKESGRRGDVVDIDGFTCDVKSGALVGGAFTLFHCAHTSALRIEPELEKEVLCRKHPELSGPPDVRNWAEILTQVFPRRFNPISRPGFPDQVLFGLHRPFRTLGHPSVRKRQRFHVSPTVHGEAEPGAQCRDIKIATLRHLVRSDKRTVRRGKPQRQYQLIRFPERLPVPGEETVQRDLPCPTDTLQGDSRTAGDEDGGCIADGGGRAEVPPQRRKIPDLKGSEQGERPRQGGVFPCKKRRKIGKRDSGPDLQALLRSAHLPQFRNSTEIDDSPRSS